MIAALFRLSPALQAVLATVLAGVLAFGGVFWLRHDARVQVVAQCAAEKQVAALRLKVEEQKLVIAAREADLQWQANTVAAQGKQLAASDEALQKAQADAEALRKMVASNPGESDVVFHAGDDWLSRRVRPNGSASPAAGRSR